MKGILFLILSAVSINAFAACGTKSCSGVYVDQLYLRNVGTHLIQTSGDEKSLNCIPTSGKFITLRDNENKGDLLSLLMAAQLANKPVTIRISEDPDGPCYVSYITMSG